MSLHYPPRRNFGRRRWDRFVAAVGIGLGFVIAGSVLSLSQCDSASPTKPEPPPPVTSSQPAASNPAPTPTATPSLVADPVPGTTFDVSFGDNASFHLKNSGVTAHLSAFITNFDDQVAPLPPGVIKHTVAGGGTWDYSFNAQCVQLDVDHPGVKLIAAAFYDKDGKVYNPGKNPEKTTECRKIPCNPNAERAWVEDPEYKDGEESSCSPNNQPPTSPSATVQQCHKKKTRTWTSTNSCTKATRTRSIDIFTACECPCVEGEDPVEGNGAPTWTTVHAGTCPNGEVGALDLGVETTTLKCYQLGTQPTIKNLECSPDITGTRNLCRSISSTTFYWYDGRDGIQNDCESEGGTFFPNYDPPGPFNSRTNVCKTKINHGSDWNYDNDEDADKFDTTLECL